MRKTFALVLFVFIQGFSFAQSVQEHPITNSSRHRVLADTPLYVVPPPQDRDSTITGDFNHDGLTDTLKCTITYYPYKHIAGVTIISGTGEKFDYTDESDGDLGSFLDSISFDAKKYNGNNKLFIPEMLPLIMGNIPYREHPDNVLLWLTDCLKSHEHFDSNKYIDEVYKYSAHWENPVPKPDAYYTKADSMNYVIFYGHNLSPNYSSKKNKSNSSPAYFSYEAITDTTKPIICFNHGVLVNRNRKYAWVFINDDQVTFGQEKLRWPSIMDAKEYKGKVIILQRVYMENNHIYISDPSAGICMRINPNLYGDVLIDKIEIIGDKLVYYSGSKQGSFTIATSINQNLK